MTALEAISEKQKVAGFRKTFRISNGAAYLIATEAIRKVEKIRIPEWGCNRKEVPKRRYPS
jgi:hypothetical protein